MTTMTSKMQVSEGIAVLADTQLGGVLREYREVKRKASRAKLGDYVHANDNDPSTPKRFSRGDSFSVSLTDFGTPVVYDNKNRPVYMNEGAPVTNMFVVLEPTDIVHVDGQRFQLVERVAQVGEKVIVVGPFRHYVNATIGETIEITREKTITNEGRTRGGEQRGTWMRPDEYRVLVPLTSSESHEPQPSAEDDTSLDRITALEQRVAALESRIDGNTILEPVFGPALIKDAHKRMQMKRDEIAEMAKADVEDLAKRMLAFEFGWNYYKRKVVPEYIENREKGTVVALVRGLERGTIYARGIAKCDPDDVFNVHIGKAIALRRALGLDVPQAYLKAPQPKKAQVGDVFRSDDNPTNVWTIDVIHVNGRLDFTAASGMKWTYQSSWDAATYHVIDDSRDGYVYDVEKWRAARAKEAKGAMKRV